MRVCDLLNVFGPLRGRPPGRLRPSAGVLAAVLMGCVPPPEAAAHPNMIRLGYSSCAVCHVSPQGGGVLTPYGRGVDFSQTLRADQPPDAEWSEDAFVARLVYDARVQVGIDRQPGAATEYGLNTMARVAVPVGAQHRLVYAFDVRSPALSTVGRMGAASVGMSRLYWMYQPRKEGLAVVVGRDELPTGLQLPGANAFYRAVNNPGVSATPTQAKVFWWNKRWQASAYAYGPDGNETRPEFEARGVGTLVAVNVWRDRAVVGLTARTSKSDAFDRRSGGALVLWGITKSLGVLAEHDITERTLDTGIQLTHLAGHAELFWIPLDWVRTALAVEHLNTRSGAETYRLSPSAEVRLTPHFKMVFSSRDVYAQTDSRTYSVMLQVKAQ